MNSGPAPDRARDYRFTNTWFAKSRDAWRRLLPQLDPARILEIGSYEGAAVCFLIDELAPRKPLEIHCVDTWAGGVEHAEGGEHPADMGSVEARFRHNTGQALAAARHPVDLHVHRKPSDEALVDLLAGGRRNAFDFVYVDGSHQAPDVLCDAVLGFRLLRVGGVMAFDDYLWAEKLPYGTDPIRCPKPAIDAFTTLYCRKLRILEAPLYQIYVQKTGD